MIAGDDALEGLLRPRLERVFLELTSRCNVRCIYCPVSLPGYHGEDLELDVTELAAVLRVYQPSEVQLSGHGETTMLPNWVFAARTLLEAGLPLSLTTNLAKRFAPDELEVLARLAVLRVSVDTCDAELLARLRRGVRLERIEETLAALRELGRARNFEPPYLQISCTFSDVVVEGLPELVRWCKRWRADALGLVNLVLHEPVPGAIAIRHPSQADPRRALERIDEARRIADELGIALSVIPGLQESLEDACR